MIRTLFISILFGISTTLFAQNEMKEINEIKSNINFLYATGTSTISAEEASRNAKDLIALEIEQWLKENVTGDIAGYVAKSTENVSEIETKRGNLYRVFVFVKKKDVLPYYKEEGVMMVEYTKTEPTTADTISINEPVAAATPEVKAPSFVPSVRERILMSIDTFSSLNDYINQGRESGLVLEVGNHKNLPPLGLYYVFIHNREGKIPAYIKLQDSEAINMLTGEKDAISNYKGCGAIWVQLKNE